MLDLDPGARRLGELGLGLNSGIDRFTGSILYDEKIGGTVHLALGQSYPETGGMNQSALHWDLIVDTRTDGRITADGRVVMQNGRVVGRLAPLLYPQSETQRCDAGSNRETHARRRLHRLFRFSVSALVFRSHLSSRWGRGRRCGLARSRAPARRPAGRTREAGSRRGAGEPDQARAQDPALLPDAATAKTPERKSGSRRSARPSRTWSRTSPRPQARSRSRARASG